jgi:hypothetical protein
MFDKPYIHEVFVQLQSFGYKEDKAKELLV